MAKDRLAYAVHILDSIETLQGLVVSYDDFLSDAAKYHASYRLLQLIAESVKRLDESFLARNPQVNWNGIRGFRNVIVHDYLDLNDAVAWEVITHHVPVLYQAMLSEVPNWDALRVQRERIKQKVEEEYKDA